MKRIGNLYDQILSIDNLLLADSNARKGKARQTGVIDFDLNYDQNIADLYRELVTKTYRTSAYTTRTIYEPKERIISILKYRDRIIQHAIMLPLEKMFVATFTADTYSCIKGKGIHAASYSLSKALRATRGIKMYCLKLDITKFYPSVDHDILKSLLRKKIKDIELLQLLDGIIDSAPGLPIGNYLSQYFANFYLSYFDHWIKEQKAVQFYWRYADDMIILSDSKEYLHRVLAGIKKYLFQRLKLSVKGNHRIFPVTEGIDFVGYKDFPLYKLMRKTIKKAFARVIYRRNRSNNPERFRSSIASYGGWAKHCNSRNLIKKLRPNEIIQPAGHTGARATVQRRPSRNIQRLQC